jgi:hypothetical protein
MALGLTHLLTEMSTRNICCGAKALRCATSRTVPRSIAGGVTEFFSDISPSDRTMALGSTQPLVKMRTRNILGGKVGRCVRLTSPPNVMKSGSLNLLEPPGPHRACYGTAFYTRIKWHFPWGKVAEARNLSHIVYRATAYMYSTSSSLK